MSLPTIYSLHCSPELTQRLQACGLPTQKISQISALATDDSVIVVAEVRMEDLGELQFWRSQHPGAIVLVVIPPCSLEQALQASRQHLNLRLVPHDISSADLGALIAQHCAAETLTSLEPHLTRYPYLRGHHPQLQTALSQVIRGSSNVDDVLLVGEPGCGRSQLAHLIHDVSPLRSYPFLELDCVSFFGRGGDESQLLTLLSAAQQKLGEAWTGTLFLKRGDELPPMQWQSLVHTLGARSQHSVWRHLGSVRILLSISTAAAHQPPNGFLKQTAITLPGLAERKNDLPQLLAAFQSQTACTVRFSLTAYLVLQHHRWPGQCAELWKILESLSQSSDAGNCIEAWQIPLGQTAWESVLQQLYEQHLIDWPTMAQLHAQILFAVHDQDSASAAQAAGLSRMQFSEIIKGL